MAKRKRKQVFNEKLSEINACIGSPRVIDQKAGPMKDKKKYTRKMKHKKGWC